MCAEDAVEVTLVGESQRVRRLGDGMPPSKHAPSLDDPGILSPGQRGQSRGTSHRADELVLRHADHAGQLAQRWIRLVVTKTMHDRRKPGRQLGVGLTRYQMSR